MHIERSGTKNSDMKKIVIVDGGPRKNMNTAQLLQRFAEIVFIITIYGY